MYPNSLLNGNLRNGQITKHSARKRNKITSIDMSVRDDFISIPLNVYAFVRLIIKKKEKKRGWNAIFT